LRRCSRWPTFRVAQTRIRRLEAIRRATGGVARDGEGTWTIMSDHLDRARAYEQQRARTQPVAIETLSTLPIERQVAEALVLRTAPRFRAGRLLKIILYGSYARGDWVEDPVGRYFSDYDLLVVVNHDDLADPAEFWAGTEERLLSELSSGQRLRTPVSLIVHSFDDQREAQARSLFLHGYHP
jgi:predicted nucleotidyltransferase